jgi:hypothetical protein
MSERNEGSDSSSSLGKDNQLFKNPESKLNQFVTSIDPENSKPGPYGDDEEGEFQEGSISKQEGGLDDKEEDSGEINEEEDIPDDQEEQDNEENGADENGDGDDNQEAEESEQQQESSSEKREEQPSASGQEQEEEEEDEEDEDLGIGNEPLNHFHLPGQNLPAEDDVGVDEDLPLD